MALSWSTTWRTCPKSKADRIQPLPRPIHVPSVIPGGAQGRDFTVPVGGDGAQGDALGTFFGPQGRGLCVWQVSITLAEAAASTMAGGESGAPLTISVNQSARLWPPNWPWRRMAIEADPSQQCGGP